jgi:hypothetical protein
VARLLDRLTPHNTKGIAWIALINKAWGIIEDLFATQQEQIDDLEDIVAAIQAAQDAADAANAAAATATAAAATAQTAAEDVTEASALQSSFVDPTAILSAADVGVDVTITIDAHTRKYPQPGGGTTNAAVNGGSLTAQPYSTRIYVYYDDAARTGGAVSYQATIAQTTAAQIGDRHFVGYIDTPAAAAPPTAGRSPLPPGEGQSA